MANLAYIIGEIPNVITIKCRQQFKNTEFILKRMGFNVINPIYNLDNLKIKFEEANKKNIRQLINCNVVYVLTSVSFENVKNVELLLAIKLNKLIIQNLVFLNEDAITNELNVLQD
jgi:hypothetical protein